jgi:hypothetical protein
VRKAVVRVNPDPGRTLSDEDIDGGVRELWERGFDIGWHPNGRDLELTVDSPNPDDARRLTVEVCERTFGTMPALGAVTFVSRGTDEDAFGVLDAFGVRAHLERYEVYGEEIVVFTLDPADRRRVPESRLHTALEAALNCEVRIEFA